jgi:hypothetical protein
VAARNEIDSPATSPKHVQRSRGGGNDLPVRKQVFESLGKIARATGIVTKCRMPQKIFTNSSSSRRQTEFSKRLPSLWG